MSQDSVLVQKEGGICTVTLNRPERRNAYSPEMMQRLEDVLHSIGHDNETRVVVLRGAGRHAFSSGRDIEGFKTEPTVADELASIAIESCPCPVLAMIYGYAIGGGLFLALGCDMRIAADNAKVGLTTVKIGTLSGLGGLERLVNVVGLAAATRILYTGRLFDSNTALAMGLVHQIVHVDELQKVTYDLANEIADNSAPAVRATKFAIKSIIKARAVDRQTSEVILEMRRKLIGTADHQEGRRAFAEKRIPVFRSHGTKQP